VLALTQRMAGGDRARAEELTQQAFVRAWKSLAGFRGGSAFGTWLHRIAVRVVLDEARSPWSRRTGGAAEERGHSADIASGLDLEAAIATLPAKARRVFVLYDVEGWRHEEIAHSLGVSVGTSKSQLSRARSLLRQRLVR
jgi:RNA polymerase sigma-70 factor (ECF subfamily)